MQTNENICYQYIFTEVTKIFLKLLQLRIEEKIYVFKILDKVYIEPKTNIPLWLYLVQSYWVFENIYFMFSDYWARVERFSELRKRVPDYSHIPKPPSSSVTILRLHSHCYNIRCTLYRVSQNMAMVQQTSISVIVKLLSLSI